MRTEKSGGWAGGILITLAISGAALGLTACNAQPQENEAVSAGEDHFHEKSFSWDNPAGKVAASGGLAKTAAAETHFGTQAELEQAVADMDEALKAPGYSDSLWKPIDYACNELTLGLWNKYGTISIGDSVVLDETSLKAGCRYIGEDGALAKSAMASYPNEAVDRQYPYKLIGDSWDDYSLIVYKSTGGETQFKKDRKRFGITGWYDTDADRIGVRIYLIDCPSSGARNCVLRKTQTNSNSHDDYASERDIAVGINAGLHVSDAVVSMHSADHAGLQFRATSSSGLSTVNQILNPTSYAYVTW